MAAHIQGRSTGGRRKRLMSEINVTPMVDVMLVLLIIFMITSPMLVAGIEVDLPKTDSAAVSGQFKPLVISVDKEGGLFLFESKIEPKDFIAKLNEITKEKTDARIFVKGDKNVSYGTIVDVMARIHNAGFTKVALVSDIMQK
ncbi:MAG: protein TolR [Rickettsiaceae bacterium]|nr:protein TolR [Rickettsiaceae bacterium]MDP4832123.1 protein TolR [Rickettsiaceae bacterium]MDP5020319.1 protein TolR [Rickettsiaceae bacterium]MDP5082639.1 protein TolR [Rickettsiaceae bacterium]